ADEKEVFSMKETLPESAKDLSAGQRDFLKELKELIENTGAKDGEELQVEVFELVKKSDIEPKEAFAAIYTILFDKMHGPKAGWVLFELLKKNKEKLLQRLVYREVISQG
ncbi:MAG: hypothetical protein ACMG6E_03450, partial [Candidatus Roizmanbacteria bacterium]